MAADPFRYFRAEAREILEGLARGAMELEAGATPQVVKKLFRLAHTLKGAARVVRRPKIAEKAHAIEDALAPLRDGDTSVGRERIDEVLGLIDAIAAEVAALDAPAAGAPAARPSPEETFRPTPTDPGELDALLGAIGEAGVQLRALRRELGALERARRVAELLTIQLAQGVGRDGARSDGGVSGYRGRALAGELRDLLGRFERSLPAGIDRVERETEQARDAAERLRLVPASTLFASLERSTRDTARTLGKGASFVGVGGDIRLEAQVLGVMQAALVQAVRNAVAHGIESDEERLAAGKPTPGQVRLEVIRRGDRVAFRCSDDGRGVDVDAVRRLAEAKGITAATSRGSAEDILGLLLEGGLTTSRNVTEVAGRGVGLDVVREAAAKLGGTARLRSERGRGASLEIVVPVSLSALDAVVVEASGVVAAIPLDAVVGTTRVAVGDVARSPGGDTLVHQDSAIPLFSLADVLGARRAPADRSLARPVLVVRAGSQRAAFAVDRLLGATNVVVRPLPALAAIDPIVCGASLNAEGNPQLVLDAERLLFAATRPRSPAPVSEITAAAPILVVDDSLTTRMLEQSILESAGYEVDVATSAEDGLEKARRKRYGLFLVDVEMPGMDGFGFVETTQKDPHLRATPAILVTSRDASEDRRRGEAVGARFYVVKGDFDQNVLLDTIRSLMG